MYLPACVVSLGNYHIHARIPITHAKIKIINIASHPYDTQRHNMTCRPTWGCHLSPYNMCHRIKLISYSLIPLASHLILILFLNISSNDQIWNLIYIVLVFTFNMASVCIQVCIDSLCHRITVLLFVSKMIQLND